jgi:hypothetical protein
MVGIRTKEVYKHRRDEVADAEPTEERGFTRCPTSTLCGLSPASAFRHQNADFIELLRRILSRLVFPCLAGY